MSPAKGRMIDHSAMNFNQICLISLIILGFIFDQPWLALFVGVVLLLGALNPKLALFKKIYMNFVKPSGLMTPKVVEDDAAPHQFAQFLGGVFLGLCSISLFLGAWTLGWVLAWVVVALAALNLQLGFCAGCFLYYQLNRRGVPGFRKFQPEVKS